MAYGESRISAIAETIFALIDTNKDNLGIAEVYMGDQNLIPKTPTVCVVPGNKERIFNGAPLRTRVDFQIYLMVYQEIIQDNQENLRQSLVLAELIENLLHQDLSMGGNCQSSLVRLTEPGYVTRSRTLMRCTRMTWEGFTVMVGTTIT